MSSTNVRRQEYKYFINNADLYKLSSLLRPFMSMDKYSNSKSNQYTVTSLYYETPEDDDLDEKIDGILVREKHRIRIYNNNKSLIKLETKKREGTVISKDTATIDMINAKELINCQFHPKNFDNKLAKLICIKLKSMGYVPRVIVEYERQAFYLPYGDIRITFDKNLRTYNTYKNLFKLDDVSSSPVFLDDNQVLEVKFSQQLPSYITDILSTIPSIRSSISKYVLSQRFINHDPRKDYFVPAF
jgi:hypothetical protein